MRHDQSHNKYTPQRITYPGVPLRSHAPQINRTESKQWTIQAAKQNAASHQSMTRGQDDDEQFQPARTPNSAIRYRTTDGKEVFRLGNREVVIHHEPAHRRVHWLFFFGLGMVAVLVVFLLIQWIGAAWSAHSLDAQYGMPRTYQIDQVVGYEDSQAHPTHFIFKNLNGHIFFIEIPGGQLDKARVYPIETIYGADAASVPVKATFDDVNFDGRLDIIIEIGDSTTIVFLNTGTGFAPEK